MKAKEKKTLQVGDKVNYVGSIRSTGTIVTALRSGQFEVEWDKNHQSKYFGLSVVNANILEKYDSDSEKLIDSINFKLQMAEVSLDEAFKLYTQAENLAKTKYDSLQTLHDGGSIDLTTLRALDAHKVSLDWESSSDTPWESSQRYC